MTRGKMFLVEQIWHEFHKFSFNNWQERFFLLPYWDVRLRFFSLPCHIEKFPRGIIIYFSLPSLWERQCCQLSLSKKSLAVCCISLVTTMSLVIEWNVLSSEEKYFLKYFDTVIHICCTEKHIFQGNYCDIACWVKEHKARLPVRELGVVCFGKRCLFS